VLILPNDTGKFQLEMDIFDVVSGAVLLQVQVDGIYKPLEYSSKLFNETEQRYTTYDKELLGIM
jgi:hypothetical protein